MHHIVSSSENIIDNLQINSLNCKLLHSSTALKRRLNHSPPNALQITTPTPTVMPIEPTLCSSQPSDSVYRVSSDNKLIDTSADVQPVTIEKDNPAHSPANVFYYPAEKDTLLDIFYFIVTCKKGSRMVLMNEKINYVIKIRENSKLLKERKIKKVVEDVECNLTSLNECITFKTFICLCIIHKIDILCLFPHSYYHNKEDNGLSHILHYDDTRRKYYYESAHAQINAVGYCDKKIEMVSYDKQLKALSAYKKDELVYICNKLGLCVGNKKKEELYADIMKLI